MAGVAVDDCHADLVYGLIRSHKPQNILELGVGSGRTTREILKAVAANEEGELHPKYKKASLTLVDNWVDWQHKKPDFVKEFDGKLTLVEKPERDFVFDCRERYDFIFSDADHWNTDKWFDYVYDRLLENNGVLMYHDVSTQNPLPDNDLRFHNLESILVKCKTRGISHVHMDRCSTKGERCYRGLLAIFKGQLPTTHVHQGQIVVSL